MVYQTFFYQEGVGRETDPLSRKHVKERVQRKSKEQRKVWGNSPPIHLVLALNHGIGMFFRFSLGFSPLFPMNDLR